MKRFLSAVLCALLLISAFAFVSAAEEPYVFPFTDISDTAWYRADVENAHKQGLIAGKTETTFVPGDNMTYAEAVKLAACMHQLYNEKEVSLVNGVAPAKWYSTYMDYALGNSIISQDLSDKANEKITRSDFVKIFYASLPEAEFAPINTVDDGCIPDVAATGEGAAEIYTFYRAGILTGSDEQGTFNPESNIVRSEVAAILTRMFDKSARKTVSLIDPNKAPEYLLNSLSMLKNQRKLTVGYFGGSVTDGSGATDIDAGSWRGITRDWLRNNYIGKADIIEVQGAQGATGSLYGVFRADLHLIKEKAPDLVFIETAINDAYDGNYNEAENYVYLETVILKIYESNPMADIVLVVTGDYNSLKDDAKSGNKVFGEPYTKLGEYYDIPVIYVGHEMAKKVNEETGGWPSNKMYSEWIKYFKDDVHPNDAGYKIYAQTIIDALSPYLLSKYTPSETDYKAHTLPEKTYCELNSKNRGEITVDKMMDATMIDPTDLADDKLGGFTRGGAEGKLNPIVSGTAGDKLTVEFTSSNISIWFYAPGGSGTTVKYRIDGGEEETLKLFCATKPHYKVYNLATGLEDGKVHTLEIEHTDDVEMKIYGFFLWDGINGEKPTIKSK